MGLGNIRPITAAQAADLASITYRQLDHWARQAWVVPSVDPGRGRGGRRLYAPDDVLRLSALRHFSLAGWQVDALGDQIGLLDVGQNRFTVAGTQSGLVVCDTLEELLCLLGRAERFAVYDTELLRNHALLRPRELGAAERSTT